MKNKNAVKVNEKLGVIIFDESDIHRLKIIKYSKKDIKRMCIGDLIDSKGQGTERLAKLVKDILF